MVLLNLKNEVNEYMKNKSKAIKYVSKNAKINSDKST